MLSAIYAKERDRVSFREHCVYFGSLVSKLWKASDLGIHSLLLSDTVYLDHSIASGVGMPCAAAVAAAACISTVSNASLA